MAVIEDYILCALALAALVWETWMIAKRNRTIKVKGKDDFFTFCIVMMFAMLFLRPEIDVDMLTSLRNTLILMALFFSLAIKRGISERGVEKICFVIPWDKITAIQVDVYQTNKLVVYFHTEKHRWKLFFSMHLVKKLVYEIQQYYPKVMISETLKIR